MAKPLKPTGNETLEVRPNTIPHHATGDAGVIYFFGTGYHPNLWYEIHYLGFIDYKVADEHGKWDYGASASRIPADEIGEIEATVNLRTDPPRHHPQVLASATFTVTA